MIVVEAERPVNERLCFFSFFFDVREDVQERAFFEVIDHGSLRPLARFAIMKRQKFSLPT